jgi:regulator of protease activity HflC (stomatin/prohibitin superfamily)
MRTFHALFAVLSLGLLGGCSETINPGEVGVVIDWGQVQNWTYPEGFHWTGGIGIDVIHMSTRTMVYEMGVSGSPTAAEGAFETVVERGEAVAVRSQDQLEITVSATVQFHLNGGSAPEIYRLYGLGYADTIVHPNVRTSIRDAAAGFNAVDLVDQREEFQDRLEGLVLAQLTAALEARGVATDAIVIEGILVQNIDLPDALDESINNVVVERQNTLTRTQALATARAEADRLRAEADGAAAAMLVRTRADAEATLVRAHAEAEANEIRAASLTPAVLRAREIELGASLLSSDHTRTIMLPGSGSPIISLGGE